MTDAPLIAETWAPITIGSTVVGHLVGLDWLGNVVRGLHLVVGRGEHASGLMGLPTQGWW